MIDLILIVAVAYLFTRVERANKQIDKLAVHTTEPTSLSVATKNIADDASQRAVDKHVSEYHKR